MSPVSILDRHMDAYKTITAHQVFDIFLENTTDSDKFYDIMVDKNKKLITITYGKIGTNGQTILKRFNDITTLNKELMKILKDKAKKFYLVKSIQ